MPLYRATIEINANSKGIAGLIVAAAVSTANSVDPKTGVRTFPSLSAKITKVCGPSIKAYGLSKEMARL
jgi:hypothetical protein